MLSCVSGLVEESKSGVSSEVRWMILPSSEFGRQIYDMRTSSGERLLSVREILFGDLGDR